MKIISYNPIYAPNFEALNLQWLEELFYVEPHDTEVLGNPEKYIIEPGGNIFFILKDEKAIGTVALMKMEPGIFELTKMAISPQFRGNKYGQKLMEHCINFAKENNYEKLIIYSSRKLENAIFIYKKFGFVEIPIEENNPYARGDIKMELVL
ncbi:MAG TPA: GNAT family N-acetyltransferase [Salinimicrobium sp.]|nr:GNAT family N-acetyltransferase [Salinimicrobium sp.]